MSALDDVPTTSLLPKKTPTELGDEISAEEAGAAKDGRNMPCYRTAPRRTLRNDRRPARKGEHIMQGPLVAGKTESQFAGHTRQSETRTLPVGLVATRGIRAKVEETSMSRKALSSPLGCRRCFRRSC